MLKAGRVTKFYGVSIIVSAQTVEHCPDMNFFYLDKVQVKGKSEAVSIFMPSLSPIFQEQEEYDRALALYQQIFKEATAIFSLFLPTKDPLATYQARCTQWMEQPCTIGMECIASRVNREDRW